MQPRMTGMHNNYSSFSLCTVFIALNRSYRIPRNWLNNPTFDDKLDSQFFPKYLKSLTNSCLFSTVMSVSNFQLASTTLLHSVCVRTSTSSRNRRASSSSAEEKECINPLTPRRTQVSHGPFHRNFSSILRRDQQKKFPMSVVPMSR